MTNALLGILIGGYCGYVALAPAKFARRNIESQNRFWGFKFGGDRTMRETTMVFRIIGLVGVGFGVALILSAR